MYLYLYLFIKIIRNKQVCESMATMVEKVNKDGSVSIKAIVRYKGVFLTKTFPVKGNRKKTVQHEAEDWARSIETQIDNGTYRREDRTKNYTVSEAIDRYIKDVNPNFESCLLWFKKEIGHIPIRNLKRSDLKDCRTKLQKKPKEVPIKGKLGKGKPTDQFITNSRVNRYLAYFSTFLTYCVLEYEILEANPMIGAKLKLKENEPRKRWLKELDERQTLLKACKEVDYELYLCVLIALTTGARKSEILNLTWKNTDLENKAIYFLNTKNGEDRTIPIPNILYVELKALQERAKIKKIRRIKNDYLFMTPEGKQHSQLIDKLYPEVVSTWGYEKITFHGLRHTYISISSLLGTNQSITKKIVGHKFDSVTGGYTHADCESLRKPMDDIANYMLNGTIKVNTSAKYEEQNEV